MCGGSGAVGRASRLAKAGREDSSIGRTPAARRSAERGIELSHRTEAGNNSAEEAALSAVQAGLRRPAGRIPP